VIKKRGKRKHRWEKGRRGRDWREGEGGGWSCKEYAEQKSDYRGFCFWKRRYA